MRVLTIDTALQGCAVGLYNSEQDTISENIVHMERGQAEHLVPMIQGIVDDYSQIDLISVTKGPGAFAGLRIGMMSAKTFGMVLNVPVVGISTFDAVAHTAQNKASVILIETKRHDYYAQINGQQPECLTAEDVISKCSKNNAVIAGNANARFQSEIKNVDSLKFIDIEMISPASLAKLAIKEFNKNPEDISVEPIYLRGPEIGKPKRAPRKLEKQ